MVKYPEGYYLIKDLVLLKLEVELVDDFIVEPEQQYLIHTVAVSNRIDPRLRKMLLDGRFIPASESVVDSWLLEKVQEDQVPMVQLLFTTSDQSAEGTTVEAAQANSIVSDAKSSGGENDDF